MTPLAILILRTFAFMLELYTYCYSCIQNGYTKLFSLFKQISRWIIEASCEIGLWVMIYLLYISIYRIQNFLSAIPVVNKYIPRSIHGNKNIIKIEIIFVISISMCRYNWFSIYSFKVSFYFILFYLFVLYLESVRFNEILIIFEKKK